MLETITLNHIENMINIKFSDFLASSLELFHAELLKLQSFTLVNDCSLANISLFIILNVLILLEKHWNWNDMPTNNLYVHN